MKKLYRGAVFYVDFNSNNESKLSGVLPAVIIQNNSLNKDSKTTIVVPISTKGVDYKERPTHIEAKTLESIRPNSIILLEQIKAVDLTRIKGYVCGLSEDEMLELDEALLFLFELSK